MVRLFFAGLSIIFFVNTLAFGYDISDYTHVSKYDAVFSTITDESSIMEGLNRSGSSEDERDYIYSAVKRVGVLKLTNFKKKLEEMVSVIPNQGSSIDAANFRNIINMSILVLGKIGDASDGYLIAQFLHDKKEIISILCLLQALGDLRDSDDALKELNEYTVSLNSKTREDIVKQTVDSILEHNSKSSISFLFALQGRAPQSQIKYINDAIVQLNKTGTRPNNSSTNK